MLEKRLSAIVLLGIFTILTIMVIVPRVSSEEYSKSWPMFRHDLMHTGYSTSSVPSTNLTLWSYATGSDVYSSPCIASGVVYVGSDDYKVYALNATTGGLIWSYSTGGAIRSSPAFYSGMVYVGSGNKIFALNAVTGAYVWSYTTGYLVESSPAVAYGTVYVGSNDYKIYALNATTGALIWSYITGSFVDSSPAVSEGIVYVGSCDYKVYALNAYNGSLVWSYTTNSSVQSSPSVVSGVVYVGSDDHRLYALGAANGVYIWNFTTGDFVYSSPAVFNGRVYVGSNDYKVYALDAATGNLLWDFTTGGQVLSSPAAAGGVVFVGSTDYNIYGLNLTDGTLVWNFNNGYLMRSSPAVAGELLYVGSDDNKIYAIGRVPCTVSITPTSVIMDVGQSVTFMSTVTGGTLPYTYQWCFTNGTMISGATNSSWTFVPVSSGFHGIYLNVTDAVSMTAKSNIATVTVNASLSVVVSPTSVVMDIGQSQLFTANVTGGTLPYTYQWYRNGTAIAGATGITWNFTPSSTGFYNVYVNVTDGVVYTAKSNIADITINSTLTISISPSPVVMDVGQSQFFNSTVSGGTLPFTYQWYYENDTAITGATNPNWTFNAGSSESFSIYANVTDSATVSFTSKSNIAAVTVNLALSVVVSPTSSVIDVGQSQLFNSTVSGGTLPYMFRWYLNGIAVPGATGSTWTLAPNSTGSYTIYVNVTDGAGFTIISEDSMVTVNPALVVSISPSYAVLDVGQSQLFSSTVSDGTPVYSYQWYLNGANVSGANSTTWTFSSATAGSYTVYLKVTDNTTAQVTSNIASVSVGYWPMFHRDLTHTGYSNSTAPSTNQLGWSFITGDDVKSSPSVLGDVVFVGSNDGKVYALGASNGTLLWTYTTGSAVSSSPAVFGGVVFVGSINTTQTRGRVYALNASTGSLLWTYTTNSSVYSSPAVVNGRVFVCSGFSVYALNASTGSYLWNYTTGYPIYDSSPAAVGDMVFVGSTDNRTYALNATTGIQIWNYTTGSYVYSSPAVAGGILYVGSYDHNVYALNASTGSYLWSYTTGGEVHSSPAVANGAVFVGSKDNSVYALNASTGSFLWSYATNGQVYSSPAAVGGKIFVGSYDGRIYALDASTGALVWNYATGGQIDSSPAVANATLFIGSNNNRVYAFGYLPLSITISPTSVIMDVGQSRGFYASITGGTSSYTYTWYLNGANISIGQSYAFYPSSSGIYTLYCNVTDYTNTTAKSNIATITVNPLPTVIISPTSTVLDVGQSKLFTSTLAGGTPPYSYHWYWGETSLPALSGGNTATWTFAPLSSGSYYVYLNITDSAGYERRSNIASVTVNARPSISITPTTAIVDLGQSKLFNSSRTGGTTPFTYQWYLNGTTVSGATGSSWAFTPVSTGPYTVYVNVTDSVGFTAKSNTANVTVNQTPTVTISPASAVMDVSQSKQFLSSVSGGTLPFAYQWYLNGTAASGATSSTWSFTPNSSGLYNIHVNVTDGAGFTAKSNTAAITVNPAPSVTVSPSSPVLDVGQSQLFVSSVSGGTPSYSYQWYLNGTLVSDATSSTWTFTPASAGSNSVSIRVNDTAGAQTISNTVTITVNAVPTVNISPLATVIDLGQSQLFTSSATGGTLPFAYQWYLNGAAVSGATGSSWTFTPGSTGPYTVYVNVTDNVGVRAKSNTASIAVNDVPSVSISPSLAVLDVGQSRQFSSTLSDGSSPYYYQWYLNNAPVSGATNPEWIFTANSTGSLTIYLNVTDGVGVKAKSNVATVTVNSVPSVTVSPTSAVMDVGQSRQFTSAASGGTSPFTYQWYRNGTAITDAISSTWTFAPGSSGSYSIYVNVTDSVGFSAKSSNVPVTVNPTLSINVSPMSAILSVGQSKLFTATGSGGTPSYSYQWYRNGTLVSGATSSTWTFTPASVGTYEIYVRVTDGVNAVAQSPNAQVTAVNPAPTVSVSPTSVVMDMGQSRQFNSTVTGGNPSFAYQWCLNGVAIAGGTDSTWTFVPSSPGSYSIYVNVTDAVGFTAKSNTATATVNPALSVSVSPMMTVLFVGQSQLFTATGSGGTPSYSYQWYRNGTLVSGATSSTWTFTPASVGTYEIYVRVTDGVNAVAQSPNAQVTANPLPQAGVIISPGSAGIDLGQSVFFTSSFQTEGTPPYTYQWYLNGSAVSGATSSNWNFMPALTGTYQVYLNVTDSLNIKVQSNTATVTTNRIPTVTVSPTSAVIEVAQSQSFTSAVSGGTSPYSYQWYLNETLVPGATSGSWAFTPVAAGQYTVFVKMTDAAEMQATSNNATVTVNVPVYDHNVAITNVTTYKTLISQNYTLNITVTAANFGELPETFNVTVYANTTIVGTQTVSNLTSGTSTVLSFFWNTTSFTKGNYTISAYAQPVPGETNTQDNNRTSSTEIKLVVWPGDLMSQFGMVDMKDIAYVAKHFATDPSKPSWDPNADINGDGKVDMRDIALVAKYFGKRDL